MDKLSSILPSSPRVQAVDLNEAPPVRPGAPTFGRRVGANTIKDRITVSQEAKDIAFQDTLAMRNPKETKGVKIVDQLAKKFFDSQTKPVDGIKTQVGSEAALEREMDVQDSLPGAFAAKAETPKTAAPLTEAPKAGTRLDVEA